MNILISFRKFCFFDVLIPIETYILFKLVRKLPERSIIISSFFIQEKWQNDFSFIQAVSLESSITFI